MDNRLSSTQTNSRANNDETFKNPNNFPLKQSDNYKTPLINNLPPSNPIRNSTFSKKRGRRKAVISHICNLQPVKTNS